MKAVPLTVTVLLLAAAAPAQSLRSTINKFNAKTEAMLRKNDIDGFGKVCKAGITSDFTYTEDGKSMTFDEMLATMKQGMGGMEKVTLVTTKILSLKVRNGVGTTVEAHAIGGIMPGEGGKKMKMKMTGKSTNTYVKVDGKWKLQKMAWFDSELWIDGKKMDPSMMGGQ